MELKDGIKTFYAKSGFEWRSWLQKNHLNERSVWLIIYKKNTGKPSVYYYEAVNEALCFGWIDCKANKRDEQSYYQSFARRNPKSYWSAVNKKKVENLIKEGKMADEGFRLIELAKKTGTWNTLNDVENLIIPSDLQLALNNNTTASEFFELFSRSSKRGILEWILNAKKEETRQSRILKTIEMAAQNKRILFDK